MAVREAPASTSSLSAPVARMPEKALMLSSVGAPPVRLQSPRTTIRVLSGAFTALTPAGASMTALFRMSRWGASADGDVLGTQRAEPPPTSV